MAKRFGVMLDMSRNAVMRPDQVKEFAGVIKSFGYNMIQMYTEDTYEVPGEPYFGYLRGRYSQAELKDMVDYCDSIGVELVPCIQTLAHLEGIFHWNEYRKIRDIDAILMVGEERTYELIENMFKSLRECYTTEYIHIGMDEAHNIGLGKYLDKHGLENRFEIIKKHIERVIKIAEKYNFKLLMWSDMFFRLANHGTYYINDASIITDEIVACCPEGVEQIYWDYYHTSQTNYDVMFEAHKKFPGDTWFGGGAWVWSGFVPTNCFTLESMIPAMKSCRKYGIDNIFLTMWGDNGRECSPWASLPSLYAIRRIYDGVEDMDQIKREFEELTGEAYDDMMMLDLPIDMGVVKRSFSGTHKYLLYNDVFLGIFDKDLRMGVKEQYAEITPKLKALAKKGGRFSYLYESMAALTAVLAIKYDLGVRTREAYQAGNREALGTLLADYDGTIEALEIFIEKFRALWYHDNKPHGFDVQEIRLGGLLLRLRSQRARVHDYVECKIDRIDELEEEILPYRGPDNAEESQCDVPSCHGWAAGTSVNRI